MKLEKLGNIATIKTGKYDVNHSTPDGEYVFYTCAFGQFKSPTYSFEGPAIILPGNGANVGEVFYYDGKFEAYQRTYVVQNFKADPNYIYAYFKAQWKNSLRNKQFGSATNYIRLNNLTDFTIALPSLPDQLHISNLLSKAENLISQRKESIRLLDEFLKSTFTKMFGNPVTNVNGLKIEKLKEFIVFLTSGGRGWNKYYSDNGGRFIRSYDVQMNYLSNDDAVYVNPPNNQEAKRTLVKPKDILLTVTGSKIGRATMVPLDFGIGYVSQHVAIIRVKDINPLYLSYYLSDNNCGQYIIGKNQYGQTKPGLNFKQIENFEIIIPPTELQTQFAQIVEKTKALKIQYQQSLQELENLYGSLSQRAFRGELTINKALSV